ncbi:unnamed protein product [Orchesella dallaii]|uniref:Uncharacterized protein n=1 Tax=Orchesella dallaii TaxID=48710 RepID=A0ABP1PSB5_9HEXA
MAILSSSGVRYAWVLLIILILSTFHWQFQYSSIFAFFPAKESNLKIPHLSFPCLLISRLHGNQSSVPTWQRLFVTKRTGPICHLNVGDGDNLAPQSELKTVDVNEKLHSKVDYTNSNCRMAVYTGGNDVDTISWTKWVAVPVISILIVISLRLLCKICAAW